MRKAIAVSIISLSLMLSPVIANAAVIPSYDQYHFYTNYLLNLIGKYQNTVNAGSNCKIITITIPSTGNGSSSDTSTTPSGTSTTPSDTSTTPSGTSTTPSGTSTTPSGTGTAPSGTGTAPSGTSTTPSGTSTTPSGTSTAPSGTSSGTMYSYTLSSDESYLANLVNQERSKNNLKSLTINTDLSYVAHLKAEDMLKNNYFSHTSPTYGSPFDMMSQFGIKYTMAGENIAENTSVLNAHNAFMNSSGHRANILNSGYTDVGIGIVKMPNGEIIAVEMFIAK